MSDKAHEIPACLYCAQTSQDIPLIALRYGDQDCGFARRRLILIHRRSGGQTPGAEVAL
jgi:hypothetical protein